MSLLLLLIFNFSPEVSTYSMLADYYILEGFPDSALIVLKEGYNQTKDLSLLKELVLISFRSRKFKEAIEAGEKYIKKDRYDPDVIETLLKSYLLLGKNKKASKLAQKIEKISIEDVRTLHLLANVYDHLNVKDKALDYYEKITSIAPESLRFFLEYASFLLRAGKPDEALPIYESLEDNFSNDLSFLIGIASCYEKLGEFKKALKYYSSALSIKPDRINLLLKMAQLSMEIGKIEDAKELLEAGKEMESFNPSVRKMLGIVYYRLQEFNKSAEELLISIALDPNLSDSYYYLSRVFYSLNNFDKAKEYVNKAISLKNKRDYFLYAAFLALNEGNLKEAENLLKKCEPEDDPYFYSLLGYVKREMGNDKEAEEALKKAVELEPQNPNRLIDWAMVLLDLNRVEEALEVFERAASLSPDNPWLWFTLAMTYADFGNIKAADTAFEKAAELDSINAVIFNNWGYLLAEKGIKLEKAFKLVKKALILDPDNPLYLDSMGWVYFKMGDFDKAKAYLERSYQKGGKDLEILEHLAELYEVLGDTVKAKEFWGKILEIEPRNEKAKEKLQIK